MIAMLAPSALLTPSACRCAFARVTVREKSAMMALLAVVLLVGQTINSLIIN
jgi:hypothetical protein